MKSPLLWIALFTQSSNPILGSPLASPAVIEQEAVGIPWTGESAVRESTAQLMAREKRLPAFTHDRFSVPRPRAARQSFMPDRDSGPSPGWLPDGPLAGNPAAPASPISPDAQTVGFSFTAATLADASGFPPDSMGAVGPTQFLVVINGRVRTFNKSTGGADGVLNTGTDNFFSSVMTPPISNNLTSDPRVRYDRLSGRWFVVIIDVPGNPPGSLPNRVLLAVSDSGTITAGTVWTYFYFQHDLVSPAGDTGKFADYPTLGIDANALYIGVNIFGSRGNPSAFSNTSVFVVRKNSVLSGGPIVVTAFRSLIKKVQGQNAGPYTPQGVDNYDPAASEGYVIGVDISSFSKLELRRISDPGGTPAISGNSVIAITATAEPIKVPHLGNTGGSSGNLDGLDHRLLAAHIRNGRLWTTQNIGVNNNGSSSGTITRNAVRWYELQGIPSGQTPGVAQTGTLFQQSSSNSTDQRHYWMGTIMVSGQGHAAMGFSVAGTNEYANAGTAGRLAGDPLGTMSVPILYTSSTTAYNPPGDPGGAEGRRWGDYSYTSLDPNDDMTMWTIQEFCDSMDSYGVRVARLLAPPPATPSSCSPSSVPTGANNVDVVVSASSAGGSGFFDPGAGFPNHITGIVNGGGVTANNITFTDPTHVTIHMTVAASAIEGPRTVTVTNPDGQSATSAYGNLAIVGSETSNTPRQLATISNRTVNEQTLLSLTATASDPDGDLLTFSLEPGAPAGASINATNGVFTWTPTEAQGPSTNLIAVMVTDNGSPPSSDARSFTVVVTEANHAPVLTVPADQMINELSTLAVTNTATDPDLPANTLTFSLEPGAPAGASINLTNGVFTWTPTEAQGPSTNVILVRVTDDGSPPSSDTGSFTVVVTEVNRAPVLTVPAEQMINERGTLVVTNTATDEDLPANTLTFSLEPGAPAGASINSTNGVFTWTPTEAQGPSTNLIAVRVTDDGSPPSSDTGSFTVVVNEANSSPA